MNFYEILKTKKLGRGSPDYWTQLFAEHVGGKGDWKIAELTGTLPMTFRADGTALIDYRIFGTAEGTGAETENWFDIGTSASDYVGSSSIGVVEIDRYNLSMNIVASGNTWTYRNKKILTTGEYTVSLSSDKIYPRVYIALRNQDDSGWLTGSDASINGFLYNSYYHGWFKDASNTTGNAAISVIIPSCLYWQIGFGFSSIPATVGTIGTLSNIMLVSCSTAPDHYIPHGYKLPLTITSGDGSKTADVYIGDSKLMAGDYIDYESGKIYKAKRIHEDTLTIDGIVWDILDYNHDEVYKADGTRAKRTVTIQTRDCINELQYSARQAAFAFPNGLAAGTYHFTIGAQPWFTDDVGKVLTFTLANAIAAGGQLVFNGSYNATLVGTTITAFTSTTSTTAAETVTMIEGNTGTDLGTILRSKTDAINSIDRALLGSNNWLESAMRQYLNSDKAAGSAWTPQTVFDRPPTWASATAGFLNGKSADFLSHIGTAKKKTGLNNISDGGGTAVHDEKFFLLSRSEVYIDDEYTGGEDTPYAYYKNYSDNQSPSTSADKNRIKYRAGAAKNWWLRSPNASNANYVRLVNTSGAWSGNGATNTIGVAPACCIVLDDMDDWVKQTFYTEVDADLPAIETFKGENTLDSTETVGEVTIKGKIKPQS